MREIRQRDREREMKRENGTEMKREMKRENEKRDEREEERERDRKREKKGKKERTSWRILLCSTQSTVNYMTVKLSPIFIRGVKLDLLLHAQQQESPEQRGYTETHL